MMVTLICAIVGAKGSAFPVDVDASQLVGHLKDAIKAKNEKTITCDAKDLQLFLTKKDGVWLSSSTEDVKKLKEGMMTPLLDELTGMNLELQGEDLIAEFLKDVEAPKAKEIHVLVVASEKLEWKSSPLGPHIYDSKLKYFWLEKEDTDDSGLLFERLMLYCRPNFHEQVKFLRERVLKEGRLGWIIGPPGTGKSTTSMAFALTVDRNEWEVIWIHVAINAKWRCVRLIGDKRMSRIIYNFTELEEVLQVGVDSKHRIVLVDGWTAADDFRKLEIMCNTWFTRRDVVMKRRLAYICSMASCRKVDDDFEKETKAMECPVFSWTLDEYIAAISDDTFFRDVEPYLGDSLSDRLAMVKAKYYYAGGSCRYMFCYNSTDVMKKLHRAVAALSNCADTDTVGQRSQLSVNHLQAMFKEPSGVDVVTPVISRYAGMVIAIKCGPNRIRTFMSTLRESSNPALNGWMLELIFFSSIQNGGLEIVDAAGNTLEKWSQSRVVESDEIPQLSLDCPVWIKPRKWNQGGYDAIMVCKKTGLVRMVQVTSADSHTFRIDYFFSWLKKLQLSDRSFEIETLEIIFVVKREKLNGFTFSTVTGQGLLEPFGWHKFTEVNRAKKVGIRGLNYL